MAKRYSFCFASQRLDTHNKSKPRFSKASLFQSFVM